MGLFQKNLSGKVLNKLNSFFKKEKEWKDIEYFHEEWKGRIAFMAKFLTQGSSIMDMGCGKMWLKDYIPANCQYYGVDYCKRSTETTVADFNKREFPSRHADTLFISGCLEYMRDPEWFLSKVCQQSKKKIILSYCILETHFDIRERKKIFWKNHLSGDFIKQYVEASGFLLTHKDVYDSNTIFVFDK